MKKGCVVVLAALIGPPAAFLAYRKPWIEPLPEVDLTPALGFLDRADVVPGSGTDLFLQALGAVPERPANWLGMAREVREHGWPPQNEAQIRGAADLLEPTLGLLREAIKDPEARMPFPDNLNEASGLTMPALRASSLLTLRIVRDAAAQDWDQATEGLVLGLEMTRILERGGLPTEALVASTNRITLSAIARRVAAAHNLPSAVRAQWIERFLAAGEGQPQVERLRLQAQTDLITLRDPEFDPWDYVTQDLMDISPAVNHTRRFFGVIRGSSRQGMERNLTALYQHLVREAEVPSDPVATRLRERLQALPFGWRWLFYQDPLGLAYAPFAFEAAEFAAQRAKQGELSAVASAAVVAVLGHQTDHGHLPQELEALVGSYLPEAAWRASRHAANLRFETGPDGWAVVADPPPGENPDDYRWDAEPFAARD